MEPNKKTNDPFFVSDNPGDANEAILAELSKDENKKRGSLSNAATMQRQRETDSSDNNWGHTIDSNDPIHGYSEDPETIQRYALEEIDRAREAKESPVESEPVLQETEKKFERDPDTLRNETRLKEVFEKGKQIRDRMKNPGSFRYRILSVAATEMKRIEQPDNPEERTKVIDAELEKAIKSANGDEKLDKYEGDVLAAVQEYVSGILIGKNAENVSIGTTKTIVGPTGQIGEDPKVYKDLVVVRWIENKTNHVLAFSPRKDAAVYSLVDDSMGESWRERFLMAGAIEGEERDRISRLNHEQHSEFAHHEKTFEKVVGKMLEEELSALNSNDLLEPVEKAAIESSIAKKLDQFAYIHSAMDKSGKLSFHSDMSETEEGKRIPKIDDNDDNNK